MRGHVNSVAGSESDLRLHLIEKRIVSAGAGRSDFKYILVIIHRDGAVSQQLTQLELWEGLKHNKV